MASLLCLSRCHCTCRLQLQSRAAQSWRRIPTSSAIQHEYPTVIHRSHISSLNSQSYKSTSTRRQSRHTTTASKSTSTSTFRRSMTSDTAPAAPTANGAAANGAAAPTPASQNALTLEKVNPNVRAAQYAVRGELALRAEKYRQSLTSVNPTPPVHGHDGDVSGGGGAAEADGRRASSIAVSGKEDEFARAQAQVNGHDGADESLPFNSVISANIGNPQQLDQKPITFFRQVASILENPELMRGEDVLRDHLGYPQDVFDRARWLLNEVKSVGAYSQSQGPPGIRQSIARFIEERDGHPSDPDSIFLTAGASSGVNTLLNIICASPSTGVMVPIPQYPLYTATLSLLNAQCVPYYLDESQHWSTDLKAIRTGLEKARENGTDVRAIAVINPGNPTGGSLLEAAIEEIIKFAAAERLVILADEVYQTNIFSGDFHSFKRSLRELQATDADAYSGVELASLHSISKGMVGECGQRGGYMELVGFDDAVVAQIYKFVSISLCPPVVGQCIVEMMVNPPRPGMPSYELYRSEYDTIFAGLRDRASALYDAFANMEAVTCQPPQGSMYLYPSIALPQKAIDTATKESRAPDEFYVSRMLDATGVCMVAGTGFGQVEGTAHFRTTFLAPGTEWVDRLRNFHADFMDQYR